MFSTTRSLLVRGLALAALIALPVPAADTPLRLGPKQSGKSFAVKPGTTLELRLSAQMGTGYSWHVTAPAEAILAQDGEPSTEPAAAKTAAGGPEVQVFRFTAKAAGQADLTLAYARSFEPGQKPMRTVTYHLKVVADSK